MILRMSSNNRLGLNIIKSTVLHTAQNIYSRPLVRNRIVKIDGRVLTESSSVQTIGAVFDDMLTFSELNISTHNIQKALGGLGAVIGSELCNRSPPSSTFVKQFSFPIFNAALLYLETVVEGDTGMVKILQSTTIRFLYVLRWYNRVSFREEGHWF